ncbi:MAG: capsule biosynthesis protein [Paracoccaceae bacterium]
MNAPTRPMNEAIDFAAVVRPPAGRARPKARHRLLALSFWIVVVLPVLALGGYLYGRAADQFASYAGFTVRQENTPGQIEMLGGLTTLGGGGATDAEVLFDFIRSQDIVARVDHRIDLNTIWSAPHGDPLFRLSTTGTVEDKLAYWSRMVRISYDANTGLMNLRVLAFAPQDARLVASTIFTEAEARINALSDQAREDATRHAREELANAAERLKSARLALTAFRSHHQMIDPAADLQGQMGLLNSLQSQLADALIELDLLAEVTQEGDSRIDQARRKISVIEARIAGERRKLGPDAKSDGQSDDDAFTTLVAEYEALAVDLEFAEQSYVAARAALDAAQAEARRQSRYLAAHIAPTLAESPQFPQRLTLLSLTALFLFLGWAIAVLLAYSMRDRRMTA